MSCAAPRRVRDGGVYAACLCTRGSANVGVDHHPFSLVSVSVHGSVSSDLSASHDDSISSLVCDVTCDVSLSCRLDGLLKFGVKDPTS